MRCRRLALSLGLCAILLTPPAVEAATSDAKTPNYRCENCGGGVGPFNLERAGDVVVLADGHRKRLLNARDVRKVFNEDPTYLLLVSLADGQKAWVLNVRQRLPEPQASRAIRRYY